MNATSRAPSPELIRILLVDHDPDDRRLLADLLDAVPGTRFLMDCAKTLAEARDLLAHASFDLCLLELRLPDGDGLDLLASAEALMPQMPVIVLTGGPSLDEDRRAMTLGAAALQDKNQLSPAALERLLRYAIHQRKIMAGLIRSTLQDETTGLISAALFRDRLQQALAFARRRNRQVAVMMIDLDIGAIGGEIGGEAGCEKTGADDGDASGQARIGPALVVAGQRLAAHLRETDSVARLSERRLALLIEGMRSLDHAATVARKSKRLLQLPIDLDGRSVSMTPSLGIAVYPTEAGEGDALIRQAETAMQRAMAEGGNCCRFGSARIDHDAREMIVLEKAFATAFERRELRLRFHPELHLASRKASLAGEVFWRHPDRGWLPLTGTPARTDDERQIKGVADWALAAASEQLVAWKAEGLELPRLTLALPFRHEKALTSMERAVREQIAARGLAAGMTLLELHEDLIIEDARNGGGGLEALAATGINLVLDGFGRGRIALAAIRDDLLHGLKLAPDLHRHGADESRVRALIGFGKALGLAITAEGAFDERQLTLLKRVGCDAVQLSTGFPPMSANAAATWLRATATSRSETSRRPPSPSPEIFVPREPKADPAKSKTPPSLS